MRHLPPSLWLLTLLSASIELKAEILTCIVPDITLDVALVTNENGTSHVNFTWQFSATYENETICPQVLSVRMFSSIVLFDFEDSVEPRGPRYTSLRYTMLNNNLNYHIFTDIDTSLYYQFELRVQANLDSTGVRFNKHFSYIHYFSEQRAARVIDPAQPHTVIRAMKDQMVELPCAGSGIPSPLVRLLRDVDSRDPTECSECVLDLNIITFVRESDAGEYFCVAANTLVNPPLGKRTMQDWKTIQLIVETASDVSRNTSYCDTYTHSTCSAYIDQSQMVFIDGGSVDGDVDTLQQQVIELFQNIERHNNRSVVNSALRDKCSQLAMSIACHAKFPYCHPDMTTPTPRQICNSTCDAFAVGGVCYDYLNADSTPELYSRLMFNCDSRQLPGGTDPECIPISIETAEIGHYAAVEHSWCSLGNGRSYAGSMDRTRSRRACQAWGSQDPHKHPFYPSLYPTELLASRFWCRNPGGVGEGPWCYTSDPDVRWEYCEVPQCEICEPYKGSFCSAVPGYSDDNFTIFVNRSSSIWGPGAQDRVESFLHSVLDDVTQLVENSTEALTPGCEYALRQLLCHVTLPFCKSQSEAAPLSVCSNQCQLMDTIHFCSADVYLKLIQKMNAEPASFFLSPRDCTAAVVKNSSSIGSECIPPPSGLQLQSESIQGDCFNPANSGQDYSGQTSITQRGVQCQQWNETHILFHSDLYPELNGSENYCRNPGLLKDRLWCFTSSSAWAYCPLPPNCTTAATTSTPGVSTLKRSTVEGTTAPATSTHVMLDPEVSTSAGESGEYSSYVLLMATILPSFVLLVLIGILLILIVAMYAHVHRVLLVNKRTLRQNAYYNESPIVFQRSAL